MSTVLIKNGFYRNTPVVNVSFELVRDFQIGANGNYVTVKSNGYFGPDYDTVRIKINSIEDIVTEGNSETVTTTVAETDE